MTAEGTETEKKYDVDTAAPLPALKDIPGVGRVGEPYEARLDAVYFDTEDLALAARRITLRRRTGGSDAGWHLKLPQASMAASEAGQRQEIHAPLGQPDVVPDKLLAHLHAYLRGSGLARVARLDTTRTTIALYGHDGVHLADFADDHVDAEVLTGEAGAGDARAPKREWREWELELVHGRPELFPAAAACLAAAGARPAPHESKLGRALGKAWPQSAEAAHDGSAPAEGAPAEGAALAEGARAAKKPGKKRPGKKWPASAVVTAYLGGQIDELLVQDPRVRLEEPDAVHAMRSAARRMRSALAVYRKLFGAAAVRRLRDELQWIGRILGTPRDAEVMLDRLREHAAELPQDQAGDVVKERVERELGTRFNAGYTKAQEVLLTDRYFRLLDDLEGFRDHPPVRPLASAPGRKVAGKLVNRTAKRLRRAQAAARSAEGTARDAALHQVRKDAKRVRHAAESVGPVYGKRASRLAKAAQKQQKILGDHHDSVIAREVLGKLGSAPDLPEPVALAYGSLKEREERVAAANEGKYRKARRKAGKLLKRGVK
ncbi:CYTH and CHAD domain-containing protein [Arthrobacter sp. ZGTC131]|uniref:CYTH and CHAD domain-containing protein n=1 Tax=Arthrobacter sp. ZGTC131 TaxID=2058898 RepID=UPI000CE3F2C0|nr:CYTH and CHAD domain-containing protein [Arthrobacter sp. ZGTC131]